MTDGFIYNAALGGLFDGTMDVAADCFRVMLVTDRYNPDPAHERRGDIASDVIAAEGDIDVSLVVHATARSDIVLGGATWPAATICAAGAVYHRAVDDRLLAFVGFGEVVSSAGGEFVLGENVLALKPRFFHLARVLAAGVTPDGDVQLGDPVAGFLAVEEAGFESGDSLCYGVAGARGIEIGAGRYFRVVSDGVSGGTHCEIVVRDEVLYASEDEIEIAPGDRVHVFPALDDDQVLCIGRPVSLGDFLAEIERAEDLVAEVT